MEIDTILFRNIIEDHGCFCPYEEKIDGIMVSHYISKNSARRVLIITSDEFICKRTAINHLYDLELGDIIDIITFN
jgi:hypothetical protein